MRHMTGVKKLKEPLLFASFLLAYSNGLTAIARGLRKDPERSFLFTNPALLLALLGYASRRRGGLAAAGVRSQRAGISLLFGLATGAALSVLPLAFFRKPLLMDTPLEYGPVATMSRRALLKDIGLRVPLNIALMEELAFRGLLYDMLRSRYSSRVAIGGTAVLFACWHFSVTYATITGQTNVLDTARLPALLKPFVPALALLGGLLSAGIAGASFAYIRERTGNLAGPVAAHWLIDGLMIAALWRTAHDGSNAPATHERPA